MSRIQRQGAFLDWRVGSGRTIEILDLYVSSELRRTGVGRKLVSSLLELVPLDINLIYAITRTNNIVAHRFYESMRFRIVANLWNFYQDIPALANTVDAIMYGKDLKEGKDA